ncbi:MAG TPA: hypothetical protein VGP64_06760 [Polyangia bacterium]|jgi:hypothetical protein
MKNFAARSSVILGLGAAALMLTSVACGSSGGSTGTGGSAGAGATTGAAGAAGSGAGAGSTGAAGKMVILDDTFDDATKGTQGFSIQAFVDPSNLGSKAADAGVPDGGTYPTIGQDPDHGQAGSGALKVTATYTNFNQYVEVLLGFSPPKDMTGAVLHASVNVVPPSTSTSFLGGAFIYAKSGTQYIYSNSTGVSLTAGAFTPLTFDFDTATAAPNQPAPFMPSMIQEIGIHIYSDGPFDGGTFAPGEYTIYIDNVIASK